MHTRKDLVDLIGNTPLVKLKKVSEETGCDIYGKCEFANPGGSVKDRAALWIIRDAEARGAHVMTRTQVVSATSENGLWRIETRNTENNHLRTFYARMLVNAGGPWVGDIIQTKVRINSREGVRLVRGSHIVTKRLYDHDKCYFFQGTDGRIIFAIPYESDFTLIGTTEAEHDGSPGEAECSPAEAQYLVDFVNDYLAQPVSTDQVVWTYSGVRPLIDSEGSARSASRDYQLAYDDSAAPLLTVLGGKLTTYRKLAESALETLGYTGRWTARAPLPGGAYDRKSGPRMVGTWMQRHPFLTEAWARRLLRSYGTEAETILGSATEAADLGRDFGATLTEAEVRHLMRHEFAVTAEDVLWRRTKLGLRVDAEQVAALEAFMSEARAERAAAE